MSSEARKTFITRALWLLALVASIFILQPRIGPNDERTELSMTIGPLIGEKRVLEISSRGVRVAKVVYCPAPGENFWYF
jgi:hypothetical protein